MQFSVIPKTPPFTEKGLTPLQGMQSAYSKPHRQVLRITKEYILRLSKRNTA